jgi:hypothetical protein
VVVHHILHSIDVDIREVGKDEVPSYSIVGTLDSC